MKLIEIDPHEPSTITNASLFALAINKPQLALDLLNRFAAQNYNRTIDEEGRCPWTMNTLVRAHLMLEEYEEAMAVFDSSSCTIDYARTALSHLTTCVNLGQFEKLPALIKKYSAGKVYWSNGHTVNQLDLIYMVCEDMFLNAQGAELANYATQLIESNEEEEVLWGFFFMGSFEKAFQAAKARYG